MDILEIEKKKIVLTGGGTAGHVYPALAVREKLGKEYEVHYIGGSGMEKDILAKEKDIKFHQIEAVKLERKLTLKNFLIPIKLFKSISQAKKILKEIKPNIVFSKGGFVALPVVIAAHKLKIPVVSHESDLTLGLANKIIFKYCDKMCTSFEKTASGNNKFVYTGQPIRSKVLSGKKTNLSFYPSLSKNRKNLLIVGGSSGAKFLNEIAVKNMDTLLEKYNVIHITGKGKNSGLSSRPGLIQVEYAENIGDYLDLADVVLSRAGSGAINEFLALNKPMLLIPLSKDCSRGDQIDNAKLFEKLGYAICLEEENCTNEVFIEKLDYLVKNDKIFKENMKKSTKNDACSEIIKIIKQYETV